LGHFEIVEAIGAGGMGQVYRARDTRLGRDVAIKILPPLLAASPGFRERFEREARTISSLNHPNICILHDIGQEEGVDYLVMEYLQGESLAERLRQGPLPTEMLLQLGVQVADALDQAHRAGLVHRDLKPGNIMVAPSGAKLLDFGVAKSAAAARSTDLTSFPTKTSPLTAQGAIVGTFQYMAPELFEGKEADPRSDIFAFGLVLYEMATGRPAFTGTTQAMVIASILKEAPRRLAEMAPGLPHGLERLIDSCLVKDPERRRQSVHDLKLELRALAEDTQAVRLGSGISMGPATGPVAGVMTDPGTHVATAGRRSTGPWFATTLLLAAALAALAGWAFLRPAPSPPLIRAFIPPPEGAQYIVAGNSTGIAVLSPDGTRLAFTARQAGRYQLWVRTLDALEAVPLPGTEGARRPFWSADGRFIAFFANGKLKKVSADGGPPLVLADAVDGRGGTWNQDGVIVFAPNYLGPLQRIPAGGGEPAPVTVGDASRVFTHRFPFFLPDGDHFLFLERGTTSGAGDKPSIRVASLNAAPGEGKRILGVASNVVYAGGHILYARDGTLLAQRFDAGALEIRGDPVVVASDLVFDQAFSHGAFSVSGTGLLAYQAGDSLVDTQLRWFDREGNELAKVGEQGRFDGPALSRDGRLLTVNLTNPESGKGDIWVYDLERGRRSRLTFDEGDDYGAIWTPDGKQVTFASARERGSQAYSKPADGSGAEKLLFELEGDVYPFSWTPDGRTLLFIHSLSSGETTLSTVTDGQVTALQNVPSTLGAVLSFDGRWIAYSTDESGRPEVFVSPFPDFPTRWQISTAGGIQPRWRSDGKEIFYLSLDGILMAADITPAGQGITVGAARPLFAVNGESIFWSYDVAPDGQRFVINTPLTESKSLPLTLVLNWTRDLDR
jgi:Tol biopolymer transport system component